MAESRADLAKKYRISKDLVAYVEMKTPEQVLEARGLHPRGDAQRFHTQNCLRYLQKYMPYRSGMMIKTMIVQTDTDRPYLICDTPFAKYLFHGKVMRPIQPGYGPFVNSEGEFRYRRGAILQPTDQPLTYDTSHNPQAGPRWDLRMAAADGKKLAADLREYLKGRG